MADPARYDIEPMVDRSTGDPYATLHIERTPSGKWVKWHDFEDYKAAQRRNASAETNERLGKEIAELRSELKDLRASSFTTCVPDEEYERVNAEFAALQAEVERLRNDANELADNLEKAAGNTASHYNCLIKWRAAKGVQS